MPHLASAQRKVLARADSSPGESHGAQRVGRGYCAHGAGHACERTEELTNLVSHNFDA